MPVQPLRRQNARALLRCSEPVDELPASSLKRSCFHVMKSSILLFMQISLVHVGAVSGAKDPCEVLVQSYLERCSQFARCSTQAFRAEKVLLDWVGRQSGRTPAVLVLLDSRGKLLTSESFAAWIGKHRDAGARHIIFAIGPASGWTDDARRQAQLLLSLGPMTLAHALARLVVAEQVYRAVTILTGHPYHCGH